MSALLRHLRIRLVASVRSPMTLAVLVVTALASFVLWPSPMPPSGPVLLFAGEPEPAPLATLLVFLWIWLWASLAGPRLGGRSAVTGFGSSLSRHPNPALPVGATARVVAETVLLFGVVLLVRAPALFAGERLHSAFALAGPYPGDAAWMTAFVGRSLVGAAIMLPAAVAWIIPSGGPQALFTRAGIVTAGEMIAMWAGLMATPLAAAATGLALAAVQLPLVGRERWRALFTCWPAARVGRLSRPALPPHRQLVRDFVRRPLPVALALISAQALLVAAGTLLLPRYHLLGDDSPGIVYMGSSLLLGLALGFLALRPLRSAQAIAGVFGKAGYRAGDFVGAWSALPVRRESVLRGVYVHGLVVSSGIVAAAIATAAASTWLETGALDPTRFLAGTAGELLVPMLAAVPCVAGLLAAGAAGRKWKATVALVAFMAVLNGHFLLLILKAPLSVHVAFLVLAAVAGGAPMLPELRRPAPAGRRGV